jgi:hypothetical protein
MTVDEETVRQLAKMIWETEGMPEGQDMRHWQMATKLAESVAMTPPRNAHPLNVEALIPELAQSSESGSTTPDKES